MVMSSMSKGVSGVGPASSFSSFFVRQAGFARSLVLTIGEMVKELYQRRVQRVRGIEPRIHRGKDFVALRGVTNVMLRDLNTAILVQGMMSGVPTLYATTSTTTRSPTTPASSARSRCARSRASTGPWRSSSAQPSRRPGPTTS